MLALATCATKPPESDEAALEVALADAGEPFEWAVWDDESVDWSRYEAVLIRTTWDYHERVEEFVAWSERVSAVTYLCNPAPIIRWNGHKGYLLELESAGVPIVPTVVVSSGDDVDVEALASARGWHEVVVKPAASAGSIGASRGPADHGSLQLAARSLTAEHDLVVQPYQSTITSAGETSTIFLAGEPSHAVRKVPKAGDYRSQPEWGGRLRNVPVTAELADLGRHALQVVTTWFGEPLYARVDTIVGDDGTPQLIELELIEPDLFFAFDGGVGSAPRLVHDLVSRVRQRPGPEAHW